MRIAKPWPIDAKQFIDMVDICTERNKFINERGFKPSKLRIHPFNKENIREQAKWHYVIDPINDDLSRCLGMEVVWTEELFPLQIIIT